MEHGERMILVAVVDYRRCTVISYCMWHWVLTVMWWEWWSLTWLREWLKCGSEDLSCSPKQPLTKLMALKQCFDAQVNTKKKCYRFFILSLKSEMSPRSSFSCLLDLFWTMMRKTVTICICTSWLTAIYEATGVCGVFFFSNCIFPSRSATTFRNCTFSL